MPVYTGSLESFGLESIHALNPEVVFEANKPAVGPFGQLFATEPIIAKPIENGYWTVTLRDTSSLITADVYYKMTVRWRDPANNYMRADFPDWKLYTDSVGGTFEQAVQHPTNTGMTIVSPVNPGTGFSLNASWLQMDPADPDNPLNPANTGDYYELENV